MSQLLKVLLNFRVLHQIRIKLYIKNYIQINNLKLSIEEFNNLHKEAILEIERFLSKNIIHPNKLYSYSIFYSRINLIEQKESNL